MYDLRNIFKQEPNAVRTAFLTLLAIPVLLGWIEISAEAVAGIGLGVETTLSLFYNRRLSVSKFALEELKEEGD